LSGGLKLIGLLYGYRSSEVRQNSYPDVSRGELRKRKREKP